jgi:metallo-beta-lactamase family protein
MAKLTFNGATGTVTGSRHLLELRGKKILIDCGMFQGTKENRLKNWEKFPVDPATIDRILLTHAHIDHSGYLPRFCKDGFEGEIFCTYATNDLCEILLRDSAHLQEEDAFWANKKGYSKHSPALPLYTTEDVERALSHFSPVHYGQVLYLDDETRIKFKNTGHILGSSLIDLKITRNQTSRKIVFSGDLGGPDRPIMQDPVQVYNVDYLVIESTYGSRLHDRTNLYDELAKVINESYKRGGVLLIPAFAVGRTQSLLYVLRELEEQGEIPSLPVFVDSPMAINATNIFEHRLSEYNLESRMKILDGKEIFHPKQLHICKSRKESIAIIISASGMVTGGRILHHMKIRLPNPENTVLLIGYQAEGTRGRSILDGQETIRIHGQHIDLKAQVKNISGFSGHADYKEILAYLMGFNRPPDKTFVVHGEAESSQSMAEKIRQQFGWEVVVPAFGDSFELDL